MVHASPSIRAFVKPSKQIRTLVPIGAIRLARTSVLRSRGASFLLCIAVAFMSLTMRAAVVIDTGLQHAEVAATPSPQPQEHGISQKAIEVARFFDFPITNSMILSWVVALGLILFAQIATRNMQQVPSGAQNFVEWIVDGLHKFLAGIIGPNLVDKTFWFFATVFIFILSANWMGLIPGIGTIGWGHRAAHGFVIDQPLLRGSNADVNMTFAMALVYFACWLFWALREIGFRGFIKELFAPKGESHGALKLLMAIVFFVAGCLEIISILFRPISLSFRLYGNVYAGENLLEAMSRLVPGFGWLVAIPFYFMEVLMGLVQALVFMLLTAVFTMLICQHEDKAPEAAHG